MDRVYPEKLQILFEEILAILKGVCVQVLMSVTYKEKPQNFFKEIPAILKGVFCFYSAGAQSGGRYNAAGAQSGGQGPGPERPGADGRTKGPMSDDRVGYPHSAHQGQESGGTKGETKKPPTQWLASDGASDPMALLAGGMAQLQAVMLRQMKEKDKDGDQSPETVQAREYSLTPASGSGSVDELG